MSPSIHDRSLQNGSAAPVANHLHITATPGTNLGFPATTPPTATADLSSTNDKSCFPLSLMKFLHRRESYERSKLKGSLWKKPFLPVMLCFLLGFLVGFMPFSSPRSSVYTSEVGDVVQDELSLEGQTHLQHESSNIGDGENQVEVAKANLISMNLTDGTKVSSTLPAHGVTGNRMLDPTFSKLLMVVTPTYNRPLQALYLTRLSHTLKLVSSPLLWLVVEMPAQSTETATLLRKTGLMYRHLVCKKNMTDVKDRGVHQRNAALAHIEQHQLDGIVYFADDDNVYSLDLFDQMRKIKRFGTWPVAMLTAGKSKAILEGPVCDGHTVVGWHTNEKSKRLRRFHVDMSGFAFNSTILWDSQRWRRPTLEPIRQLDTIKEGLQETTFIQQLVEDESQMEGLPSGCSKVMVWHLHFEAPDVIYPPGWRLEQNLNATVLL